MIEQLWNLIKEQWPAALEVVAIVVVMWLLLRRFRFTLGIRIFLGSSAVLLIAWIVAEIFQLQVISLFARALACFIFLTLIVVFQPELRRAVFEVGSRGFLFFSEKRTEFFDQIEEAVRQLSAKRFGALIAIERGIELRSHLETGVRIDSRFSVELMLTIFHPRTALHDGGMIVRDGRIRGAACVFPVSQRELFDRSIGLRHRAGIGITEESDAIAVVVSEESGDISICHNGKLERDFEINEFRTRLVELLSGERDTEEKEEETEKPAGAGKGKKTKSANRETSRESEVTPA